ncbi:hypothetical protein M0811_11855 [Anaeramoeba ignava]|uniref:Uncharacterized protein n=1 Tax=Anaeramoeba ignava TaxID=1746090 RepID=A0A9Q0R6K6_ANAIG|nr:hypothetical protein M0811_11855 [Anaeramoeba ignava]
MCGCRFAARALRTFARTHARSLILELLCKGINLFCQEISFIFIIYNLKFGEELGNFKYSALFSHLPAPPPHHHYCR